MTRIHIEHGRIVDPANAIDKIGSLYVDDGKIVSLFDEPPGFSADTVIDAHHQVVCPGFIDISTRLRQPGQSHKATIASETRAAAAAGITALVLQPDTVPPIDTPALAELVKELAEEADYRQIYPIGALTQNLEGRELSSMLALKEVGCIAVGNAGRNVINLLVLRRAMEYAASHGLLLIFRPNEQSLGGN
ncbi:MAG: dihydroorotase, partial [Gammaproteobacteria bacterium]